MSVFPDALEAKNNYFNEAVPYLTLNKIRLNLGTSTNLPILTGTDMPAYQLLWTKHDSKTTQTHDVNVNLGFAIKAVEKTMTAVFAEIPQAALTPTDRIVLHLHLQDHTHHSVHHQDDLSPLISIMEQHHLAALLRYQNPETPDSSAMPHGHKVYREIFIGDKGLADDAIAFAGGKRVNDALSVKHFTEADVQKTCYIRACYETEDGKKRGVWSVILKFVIS